MPEKSLELGEHFNCEESHFTVTLYNRSYYFQILSMQTECIYLSALIYEVETLCCLYLAVASLMAVI